MKKHTLLALFLFVSIAAMAQSISVKSFKPLPMDMTASSLEGKKIDQNGDVAALIKVVTNETGFVFEGGTLGIVDTKQNVGEVWVWVPRSSRKITIKHQHLGVLRDYRFPVEIESERTYEMVLTTAKIETIVKEEVRQQYLAFQITPANAILEVNDEIWPVEPDGSAMNFINFDTYTYRVQAPNYHTEAGQVTVNDPDNTQIVTVSLRPNFGWIEVTGNGNLKDGLVYVDNAYVGKAPCKSDALKSGPHIVRIVKKMYNTYSEAVTVRDNETTNISPVLQADYAEVTLKVDADAEIWVNNEYKGTRIWSGPLGSGTYKIECKITNHETSLITKEITPAMNGQTISLPTPTPINGSLMVESNPNFCKLYIDGKDMGSTPKSINEILIGQHEIKLTKDGYADYTETVTIAKGERKQVQATLSEGAKDEETFTVNGVSFTMKVTVQACGPDWDGFYELLANSSIKDKDQIANVLKQIMDGNQRERELKNMMIVYPNLPELRRAEIFVMKLVEGGTFQMGATSEQGSEADSDEKPVHSVTLSDYYIGETEVTQALWKAVMGSNPSYFKGDNLPVEQVSWDDCQEFIRKLNQKTGKNFRLPTEAEWEYAARGGKKSKGYKYAGSNTIGNIAWYADNSGGKTHPIKSKSPNELGLYDMSGNAWEWCQDWYGSYSSGSVSHPAGPSTGLRHVLRGGSYNYDVPACRVSHRNSSFSDYRSSDRGFRLVLPQ